MLSNKILLNNLLVFCDILKNEIGLAEIILSEINKWNIGDKIICQTYDGASVMLEEKNGVLY